ncbi:MAG: hypothetical protein U5N86_04500 [Planctomycetota bacterium]|nr:hypothetical protein [Planctomycetota bacterium]
MSASGGDGEDIPHTFGFTHADRKKLSEAILTVADLAVIVLAMPIIGLQVIGASLFQALGKAFAAMFLSTSRQVLFLVPLILILPHYMDIDGVWWAFPIADVSATVITMFWVRFQVCEFDKRDCGPPGVGT